MGGRWTNHSSNSYFRTSDCLYLGGYEYDTYYLPRRIGSLRLDKFQATFKVARYTGGNPRWAEFNFNIQDEDDHLGIWVKHGAAAAPVLKQFVNGQVYTNLSCTTDAGEAVGTSPLWVRVIVDPDDDQSEYIKVYESTTEGGLDTANECLIYSGAVTLDGGYLGFGAGYSLGVDELEIKVDTDDDGDFDDETAEFEDEFEVDSNNRTENDCLEHDAAGNLTYDGQYKFVYDAWNRLVEVKRAYRNATTPFALNETSSIATMAYDGLGRRIRKAVTNSADWTATYHYYYDGYRMIETHDGSADVLKQHVWGQTYVDELIQIGLNDDPTDAGEDDCETFYYAMQDANFNVLGLADEDGDLVERYEYSPYGQRTIYKSAGSDDPMCSAPILESQRVSISSVDQPYSLCDIGHQGLMHDKEFGLIYNRARYLHPLLGRFLSRDPLGYRDGMSLYEYVRSAPSGYGDPSGLWPVMALSGLAGNPVHEGMIGAAWAAANASGRYADKGGFMWGLNAGVRYLDMPNGVIAFGDFFGMQKIWGTSPLLAMERSQAWTTYRSHFGDLQWWHGMTPGPGAKCKDLVNTIADWIVGQYQRALDALDAPDGADWYTAGIELGKGLHTLQDMYDPAHTTRVERTVNGTILPMEITGFQDYSQQDPNKHSAMESLTDKSKRRVKDWAGMATYQTTEVFKMFHANRSAEDLRKWLTEGDFAPLNMSKICKCPPSPPGPRGGPGPGPRGGPPGTLYRGGPDPKDLIPQIPGYRPYLPRGMTSILPTY